MEFRPPPPSARASFTAFARLANGTVVGWGDNSNGQLATGAFEGPETCDGGGGSDFGCSRTPIPVGGLARRAGDRRRSGAPSSLSSRTARREAGDTGHTANSATGQMAWQTATPVSVSNLSGASALGPGIYMAFALIGPSQTLSVDFAGAGSGSVTGREVSCPPRCTGRYSQGQVAPLIATSANFAGFSGPCTGTGVCQAKMDSDQTVTATFGVSHRDQDHERENSQPRRRGRRSPSAPLARSPATSASCRSRSRRRRSANAEGEQEGQAKPQFASCSGPSRTRA